MTQGEPLISTLKFIMEMIGKLSTKITSATGLQPKTGVDRQAITKQDTDTLYEILNEFSHAHARIIPEIEPGSELAISTSKVMSEDGHSIVEIQIPIGDIVVVHEMVITTSGFMPTESDLREVALHQLMPVIDHIAIRWSGTRITDIEAWTQETITQVRSQLKLPDLVGAVGGGGGAG